jgi:hypothetical protein
MKTSPFPSLLAVLSFATLFLFAQEPKHGGEASTSGRWSVSAGPLSREFDGGSFQSGSRSRTVALPTGPNSYELSTGAAGPENGETLRTYSDGFVGPDTAGTTTGSFFENTTSRFGFDSDSQNNADTTLVFQAPLTGEERTSSMTSSNNDLSWSDDPGSETGAILEVAYRITPAQRNVDLLAQLSFLYSPFEIQGGGNTFNATRTDIRRELSGTLTDTYAVPTGVILPLAPYSQPSANPPPGFYPRIMDEPSRTLAPESRKVGTDTIRWFNQIEEQVEADVFTVSLGPEVLIRVARQGFVSASAGVALNVVDWQASHHEALYRSTNGGQPTTVQEWRENSSSTDLVWGGFAQAGAGVHLGPEGEPARFLIKAFARWEANESLNGTVGPSEFDIDLDAFTAGAMAGFFF